eukprot:scaffold5536_cov359-Prasinococcus_capsulatus_cf.AAC.1
MHAASRRAATGQVVRGARCTETLLEESSSDASATTRAPSSRHEIDAPPPGRLRKGGQFRRALDHHHGATFSPSDSGRRSSAPSQGGGYMELSILHTASV